MPTQTQTSTEDLLRRLPPRITAIEHLLDAQPDLATIMATELRKGLAKRVPANPPNPDTVYLNEYDIPSQTEQDSAPRITRTRNLTQVLQETIATQNLPTELAKEPQTGSVSQAVGFYPTAHGTGRDTELADLEISAVNALISDLQLNSQTLYVNALRAFWSSPHASTGALSVLAAVSQKQREVFTLEADLKVNDARQQVEKAEQNLKKAPEDTQTQAAVATAQSHLQVLIEGRQLIENRVLHETTNNATPPLTLSIALNATGQPDWTTTLNGCFVLTERLHGPRPTVLYTPQWGGEFFESFSSMENALRLRLVRSAERDLLFANIAAKEHAHARGVLPNEQKLSYAPITGQVFNTCLHAQLIQQEADIDQAFETSHTTFETLAAGVRATLALPLKGNPGLIARMPVPLDLTQASPDPLTQPTTAQQTHLIQQWNSLNQQLDQVLEKHKHLSLDAVLTSLLNETFVQLPDGTGLDSLYVNRYRIDSMGARHFESSRPLLEAVCTLLLWGNTAVETDEDHTTQKDDAKPVETFAESVFRSATAFSETDQLNQTGTLSDLAHTLKIQLAERVTAYWRTPIAPELVCPQVRLIDVQRQTLDVQARLRVADNTLSPQAKLLIDRALRYPTQARREASFSHGNRPGVYQLTVATARTEVARMAGSFILTFNDGSSPVAPHWPHGHKNLNTQTAGIGPVVLYTPDMGFEECASLQALHDRLKARINAGEDAGRLFTSGLPLLVQHGKTGLWGDDLSSTFAPIADDFVADSIQALLDKQQSDIETILGLTEDESDSEKNGRVELAELVDMAGPFLARNRLLTEHWRPDWEKRLSAADKKALQDQADTTLATQDELAKQWQALIPTLAEYAKQQVLTKIRALLVEAGQDYPAQGIDPDKIMVVRTTRIRISSGGGFGSVHEGVKSSRMSLTNLLLKNTKPWQRGLNWEEDDLLKAQLTTSQGEWVRDAKGAIITLEKERLEQWLKDLDVGQQYAQNVLDKYLAPQATAAEAHALKQAWIACQTAVLDYAALAARLNPDIYRRQMPSDTGQKKADAWVGAVLASPSPATRLRVDGQTVIANALMFNPTHYAPQGSGGQTVNGVLILSTDADDMRVLYTPNAPDGVELRELVNETELVQLMRGPAWLDYLRARLPAGTRLLNHRLAAHQGDVLVGLYRQNYLYLLDKADTESVTNEELEAQSTLNKVLFGVEVALTVLGGLPWSGQLASSAARFVGRVGRTTVHALRSLGQTVAGLVVRRGSRAQTLFELARVTTTMAGVTRTTGLGIKPLSMLLRPGRNTLRPDLLKYQNDFLQESARLVVKGGIPAGAELAEGTGIYRVPGTSSTYLVRSVGEKGEEQVFRIQNTFNLYDNNGLVAPVLTPSGGVTPFRLRRLPTKFWELDTWQRLPGAGPKTDNAITQALREWDELVKANAAPTTPQNTLDPTGFFTSRGFKLGQWNKLVRSGGEITQRGLVRLNPESATQLSDELFMKWVNMEQPTREAADAFVKTHGINPDRWSQFVSRGKLNKAGEARKAKLTKPFNNYYTRIFDQDFLDWYQLALRPENQNKAAAWQFAVDRGLHPSTWMKYVNANGTFNTAIPTVAERVNRLKLEFPRDLSQPGPSLPPS
ncbi:hypothetical protein [Pseudomonas azotoformans]|uniref:hypothetical protein n=1 Tax=Pseudomonas azotoformans TaxID=47878 RepID=UPI00098EE367|nr:hypothetical protein [Pseudomonas azotoformans]AQT92819.1 hypothetical protein B1R45_05930 [Pseudomonas azotoformans]UMY50582.1 hypothetical protein MLC69_05900 [Pseudomonas azotoformans]